MGLESKKEWIYLYVQPIHLAVQQKLTQHCTSILLQEKLIDKKEEKRDLASLSVLGHVKIQ